MRIWKEPLAQFLVLGGLLFLSYSLFAPEPEAARETIVVDAPLIASLEQSFEAVWKRSPTPEERQGLVDDYLAEEVFYREAQKLGLDQDDVVIRRRMRQKMEFLLQDGLARTQPDEAVLRAFFEADPDRYKGPDRFSFRQIFLGDGETDAGVASWKALLVRLNSADPPGTRLLGSPSLLPAEMNAASVREIDGTFGDGFATRLSELPAGKWVGPVASSFGSHVVFVEAVRTADPPEFDAVRAEVERDFAFERQRDAQDALIERLKQEYEIVISEGGT